MTAGKSDGIKLQIVGSEEAPAVCAGLTNVRACARLHSGRLRICTRKICSSESKYARVSVTYVMTEEVGGRNTSLG